MVGRNSRLSTRGLKRLARIFAGTLLLGGLLPLAAASSTAHAALTLTFDSPGEHAFTVPAGVTSIAIEVIGGKGGDSQFSSTVSAGGSGADVTGTLSVTPGDVLYVEVGGNGGRGEKAGATCLVTDPNCGVTSAPGGSNGGGGSGTRGINTSGPLYSAGGGGGALAIQTCSLTASNAAACTAQYGTGTEPRLVVAGGGGGASGTIAGGNAGNANGSGDPGGPVANTSGCAVGATSGDGATVTTAGAGGIPAAFTDDLTDPGVAGGPGTAVHGGNGAGTIYNVANSGGGGGGSGFFGGGGGGNGASSTGSGNVPCTVDGAGGAGSSYPAAGAGTPVSLPGGHSFTASADIATDTTGLPQVTISYATVPGRAQNLSLTPAAVPPPPTGMRRPVTVEAPSPRIPSPSIPMPAPTPWLTFCTTDDRSRHRLPRPEHLHPPRSHVQLADSEYRLHGERRAPQRRRRWPTRVPRAYKSSTPTRSLLSTVRVHAMGIC